MGVKTKVLEDYIRFAEEKDIRTLTVSEHGVEILIRREEHKKESPFRIIPASAEPERQREEQMTFSEEPRSSGDQTKKKSDEVPAGHVQVKAPFVGIFYRKPSPEAGPFVKEGDIVSPGQTLCILEAMKVMNRINAEKRGRIVKVMAEDASPVKKDDVLFLIEPQA